MIYKTARGASLSTSGAPTSWIGAEIGAYLSGTSGNDELYGNDSATLAGGLGDDTYMVWVPSTHVLEAANAGIDTLDSWIWGTTVLPENFENLFLNGPGSTGGTGNASANIIAAGEVGATLDGLGGDDVLIGGAAADIFRIEAGNGSDAIVGFTPGSDVIELIDYGFSNFAQVKAIATKTGKDLTLHLAQDEILVLRDTKLAQLDGYDFGFPPPAPAPGAGQGSLSGPGAVYTDHGWYVLNNAWNAGGLTYGTDYRLDAIYDPDDLTTGVTFSWSFPRTTQAYPPILAYPEVIFGPAPMSGGHKVTDTADFFPLQVGEIQDLTAAYDVRYDGNTDWFNVAFDIWLTDVPNGGPSSVTNEVMVWVHQGAVKPFGDQVGTYSDGTIAAKIHSDDSSDWTYTAVVLDSDHPVGTISITGILSELESLGIVSPDEYIGSVELGSEIVAGAGRLTINELTLTARLDDRTLESSGAETTVTLLDGAGTQTHAADTGWF
ncbi:GH12 family glycosyl hydrolase domain-containing protein [Amaricoccus solimangrovi]|uniref:Uncharacterized protein n=1 Tax=Amaricoccus solimangrovi TaxID=2589815 RepID=A0A501WP98_9RHOB|nr:hypothetical protein [Amaricoccus solimangrovi]TPE49117.1 hypothetical protein FJM51_15705 [Amaricoccus solimangrovi]